MGHIRESWHHDNPHVMRRPRQLALALVLVLAQLLAFLPDASADSTSLNAAWTPRTVDTSALNGNGCSSSTGSCAIARGMTYTAQAKFTLDQATDPLLVQVDPGGL